MNMSKLVIVDLRYQFDRPNPIQCNPMRKTIAIRVGETEWEILLKMCESWILRGMGRIRTSHFPVCMHPRQLS